MTKTTETKLRPLSAMTPEDYQQCLTARAEAHAKTIKERDALLAACKDLNGYLNAVANQLPAGELSAVLCKIKSSQDVIDGCERGSK